MKTPLESMMRYASRATEIVAVLIFGAMMFYVFAG